MYITNRELDVTAVDLIVLSRVARSIPDRGGAPTLIACEPAPLPGVRWSPAILNRMGAMRRIDLIALVRNFNPPTAPYSRISDIWKDAVAIRATHSLIDGRGGVLASRAPTREGAPSRGPDPPIKSSGLYGRLLPHTISNGDIYSALSLARGRHQVDLLARRNIGLSRPRRAQAPPFSGKFATRRETPS